MKKQIGLLLLLLIQTVVINARQGMWMPNLLKQLNADDLKAMGLSIPVEDLFRADGGGLNDAIVQFGGGCTGEIVSDSGLLLTNHHCGYGQLQALSTLEKNYVRDGFWAASRSQELPCPGLTVTFVRDIIPVTDLFIRAGINGLPEAEREKRAKAIGDSIETAAVAGKPLKATVRSFYGGNEYYLFITEIFRDVRLVGAPPSYIGNYGGETDNWMWPRHTGDFTVFRVYAGSDNRPADFNPQNRPYRPGRSLVINTDGPTEGGFTMVYGFPGRTQQFLPSAAIRLVAEQTNPNRIRLRDVRMNVWEQAMAVNDTVQLKYSSKYRSLANAYKKWKGETEGLRKSDALRLKQEYEQDFRTWTKSHPGYTGIIDALNAAVDSSSDISRVNDFFTEGLSGIELISTAARIRPLLEKWKNDNKDTAAMGAAAKKILADLPSFYKNYSPTVDKQVCREMLEACDSELKGIYRPKFMDEFKKDPDGFLNRLYAKSNFTDLIKATAALNDLTAKGMKSLVNDPAWVAADQMLQIRTVNIDPDLNRLAERMNSLQRTYTAGQLAMKNGTPIAPDANSTLRVSYGKAEGMRPADGIEYDWQTTTAGILEKSQSGESDYAVPVAFKSVIANADKSRFAGGSGMPVAFIASNHTTGGNSGSPVLDNKGRLIGINFDRIWEGVMSDLYYYDRFSRNVAVDIRYVLFVIDEVGKASWLFEEMRFEK